MVFVKVFCQNFVNYQLEIKLTCKEFWQKSKKVEYFIIEFFFNLFRAITNYGQLFYQYLKDFFFHVLFSLKKFLFYNNFSVFSSIFDQVKNFDFLSYILFEFF